MTLTKDDEEVGSQETEDDGCAVWSDLGPGDYSVAEETREGWTNLNSTTHDFGTVESGETYTHTFVNTQLGSITVEKQTNPDADETTFDFTGEIEATLSDGQTDSKLNVLPGTYEVTETAKTGWDLTNIICSDENSAGNGITRTASFNVEPGEDVTCTFNNQKRGSIVVTKYQDNNGNGQQDANEPELEGWDMTLNQDGPQFPLTQSTGQDGTTTFDNLYPASYGLSETIKEGWTLSDISCTSDEKAGPSDQDSFLAQPLNNVNLNNHLVDVEPGQTTECYVGNIPPVPVLTIDKSNNTGGADKRPSQDVVFTLTVTASDSDVINTKVVDLPAGGFAYRAGSWTANSNVRGDLKAATITTEPTYASPGTWNLGDMVEGEVVTLTYVADIANDQQTGLYKDLAWTEGESLASAQVLGNESTGTFVGTDVNVITDPQTDTAEISVKKEEKKEGDVLGAVLPATGADSQWVMFGLYGLASGFLLVLIGLTMRAKKLRLGKYFAATIFAVALTLSTGAVRTEAAATNLSVRLYQPDSPSNNEDLKLNFVTLDTLSRGITARCYKKGPSDAIFTQFGSDINISPAGGNNANCVPGSAVLSSTGTYSFYVGVTADAESVSSAVVSLDFVAGNSEKPGAPYNYSKSKIESCKYRISFHTSNDSGKTVKVALYRSENTSFGIDDSNKVGEVAIGSNADGQIDNTIPDCDKTYYYAIRAYNLFGKGSDVVGDSVTVTITEGGTTTTTTAASSPAGTTTGGALPSTESQVEEGSEGAEAEEGETQGETAEGKAEEVLGAQSDKNPAQNLMKSLASNPVGTGVGLVIFAIIAYVFFKKNPFKKAQ